MKVIGNKSFTWGRRLEFLFDPREAFEADLLAYFAASK